LLHSDYRDHELKIAVALDPEHTIVSERTAPERRIPRPRDKIRAHLACLSTGLRPIPLEQRRSR
jgi:hypothetical protein